MPEGEGVGTRMLAADEHLILHTSTCFRKFDGDVMYAEITVFIGRQSRHLNFRLLPARNVNSNMLDKYGHGFSSFTAILPNT